MTATSVELVAAFMLMFVASFFIYICGRWLSPQFVGSGNSKSAYACGEKAAFQKLRTKISFFKYLVYFVVLDSSVLLLAFASLMLTATNILLFIVYLSIVFISSFLLLEGGDQ